MSNTPRKRLHKEDGRLGAFFMGVGYLLITLSLIIHPPVHIPGYKYTSFDIVASAHIWLVALGAIGVLLIAASVRPKGMILAHGFAGTIVAAYAIASLGAAVVDHAGFVGFGLCVIVASMHFSSMFHYQEVPL
jgi:hypothetical protein